MAGAKLSKSALERLQAEFHDLTTRGRIEVADKIERAREEGDLKENAGYHAAKDEQGHMEGRIRQLEHMLDNAEIVEDQKVYTIVYDGDSEDDAERYVVGNIEEEVDGADVISASSPLGSALMKARVGEIVRVDLPKGPTQFEILEII